jgi:hypothetical protein
MQSRWHSIPWVVVLAVVACGWLGSNETLRAAVKNQNVVQGTVVSISNNSITISVKQKNQDSSDQLTLACSAQTTKVGLKTPDGVQQVSGQSIGVGDKVAIRMSVHGSENYVADGILILSQGKNQGSTKGKKSQ